MRLYPAYQLSDVLAMQFPQFIALCRATAVLDEPESEMERALAVRELYREHRAKRQSVN